MATRITTKICYPELNHADFLVRIAENEFKNITLIKKDGYDVCRLSFGTSGLELVPELGNNAIRLTRKIGGREYEVLEAPQEKSELRRRGDREHRATGQRAWPP